MARMRYVKPEFWTDSRMVSLTRDARLFYIGTWNFALCDRGHLEDDPLRLKMQIFPADNVDVPALLGELIGAGRIVRLTDDEGQTWLQVARLGDHQKVDPRWTPRCPACKSSENLTETQESLGGALTSTNTPETAPETVPAPNLPETLRNSPQEGIGGEGIGERKTRPTSPSRSPRRPAEPDTFDAWWDLYPRKEGKGKALPAYRKAIKDIDAAKLATLTGQWFADRPDLESRFIPLPASWLNGQRWTDARPVTAQAPSQASFWNNRVGGGR